MMAPAGLMCACMCVYYVLHDRPLTLHWSDRSSLEATVISPDLSKASAPPPIFIMTISNFNFQFLPPSSSQFATKLHPCERRWGDCRTRGCKNIYDAARGKSSQITIDYCHIECKCMFVWVCAHVQHKNLSSWFRFIFDLVLSSTCMTLVQRKNSWVTLNVKRVVLSMAT